MRRRPAILLALLAIALAIGVGALLLSAGGDRSAAAAGADEGAAEEGAPAPGSTGDDADRVARARAARLGGDAGLLGALPPWLPTASVVEAPDCPHGGLSGRVISASDGSGIAGAELVFDHQGTTTSAVSGDAGAFALCVAAEGRYVLAIASREGFLPYAPEWGHSPIALVARRERRIDGVVVQLAPTVSRVIEVVDAAGAGVVGATVELVGGGEGDRAMSPLAASVTTDDEGAAAIDAWPGALVEASHEAHGRGRTRLDRGEGPVRITLDPNAAEGAHARLRGRVIDDRGAPIAGAVVSAFLQRRGLHPSAQGASDDDGFFALEGLDEGPHYLAATHPAHPRTELFDVATGREDVTLRMPSGASLEGRVIDEAGAPVPAFNVVARVVTGTLLRRTVATVASYDAQGEFRVSGLAPGDYELVATSRGYPPSAPVAVTTSARGAASVTLRLARGGRVEGRVTGIGGEPVAGARVALESALARGASAAPVVHGTVTDADGAFVLDGIGREVASLRVEAAGHHERMISGVSAAPGAATRVEVALTPLEDGEAPRLELAGIGVTLFPRDDMVFIGSVIAGGSAHEAGLTPGDRVHAVDGAPVTTLGFDATLDRIRGPEGTSVRVRIQRRGEEAPIDLVLARRRVRA